MRIVVCTFLALGLLFSAPGFAQATDYCPLQYYGFINNTYVYYCHYCDAAMHCQTAGVSVGSMYSCGGDFPCCVANATCSDVIPGSAVYDTDVLEDESKDGKKKPASTPKSNRKTGAARTPTIIGEQPQKLYIAPNEKFILSGTQIQLTFDGFVKVAEPDGTNSYFRLFTLNYVDKADGVIHLAMEMDPDYPPVSKPDRPVNPATRAKKGTGMKYKHTVTDEHGVDFDASSVRVLADKSN